MTAQVFFVSARRTWQYMTFGEWLKSERLSRGWTLEIMADKADTSHASISRLESGRAGASQKMVARLAEALAGDAADPKTVERLRRDGLAALVGLEPAPEMTSEPNEEELQRALMAYTGDDPVLSAAKNTAEAVAGAMKRAGAALTGEEPEEYIVRGRRKGVTRIDE